MKLVCVFSFVFALGTAISTPNASAGGYKIVASNRLMGTGRIDYVSVDSVARRIYVPRGNQVLAFNLDTLKYTGAVTNSGGHGVAIDPKTHHAFSSSNPITMFDTETLATIKTVQTQGRPDGIFYEPFTGRIYVLSHEEPNVTVLDPANGSILGTINLGGDPEQAASDGAGHVYIDLENKSEIAVVDPKTLQCTGRYSLGDKGGGPAGLGLDAKNHILFAMCREPATCVVLDATDGKILASLPIGKGTDSGGFNPATMEAFSSQGDGTLSIIKENSPTSFELEQTVITKPRAKTCALDARKNQIVLITLEPAAKAGASAANENSPGRRGSRNGPAFLDVLVVGH